jgi:hypothetical protein
MLISELLTWWISSTSMLDDAVDPTEPKRDREDDDDDGVTLEAGIRNLEQKQLWARRT